MEALLKPVSSEPLHILLINGPNLNLLGIREPEKYGSTTLKGVERICAEVASTHDATFSAFQSNHEGAIVDKIHEARITGVDGVVINPGAYTHTSVAIRDAFAGTEIPYIEVKLKLGSGQTTNAHECLAQIHLTNVHAREPFRHHSYLSDKAVAVIAGMGVRGYKAAMEHAILGLPKRPPPRLLQE